MKNDWKLHHVSVNEPASAILDCLRCQRKAYRYGINGEEINPGCYFVSRCPFICRNMEPCLLLFNEVPHGKVTKHRKSMNGASKISKRILRNKEKNWNSNKILTKFFPLIGGSVCIPIGGVNMDEIEKNLKVNKVNIMISKAWNRRFVH